MNDPTSLMAKGAEEAIEKLNEAVGILMKAEHTPDPVKKEYLEEKINEAHSILNKVMDWLYSIKKAGGR
jgi:hypothetical protein